MLEKWQGAVDDRKVFAAILADLSSVFDCFFYELIIAKINAYGFSLPALKLIYDYLSKRQQRTEIDQNSVHGKRFYLEYLSFLCLGLYYSISF